MLTVAARHCCSSRSTLISQRRFFTASTTSNGGLFFNPLQAYQRSSKAAPLATAFATCMLKGSASDAVAQLQVEKCSSLDLKRNFAFGFFSGAHLGIGQHLIYNVAFTRAFGKGTDALTALKKVIADSTVHVPLIYLPLYYPFKAVALGEGEQLTAASARFYGHAQCLHHLSA